MTDKLFSKYDDSALLNIYRDYMEYDKSGLVPNGGEFAKARDEYCKAFSATGLIVMEHDLLYEIAKRWSKEQKHF